MTTTTTSPTEATEPQVPPAKKNVFARFAGVLFAPADAFQEIVRRPDILAPLLIVVALGYATTALIAPRIDFESVKAMQAEQITKSRPGVSAADLERFGRMAEASTKVFLWLSPFLGLLLFLVFAGILLGAFRMMGGVGTFEQALSVTIYAWTPLLLFGIITAIVVLGRGSFDPTTAATLVKSNPAFLVEMKEHRVLFTLLASIDVFTIWTLILFILGFSTMSRLSKGTSAAIVLILFSLMVVVRLGFAAMQG